MDSTAADPPHYSSGAPVIAGPRPALCLAILLALYAAGLTHGLSQPWVGMHDWNGAFFSQLARNLLRYPLSVHHGMGVVAMGEDVPPPEGRSIYATHPPALIWLVALSFRVFGEAEWVARLVPVSASLGSLWLLVSIVRQRWGREAALLSGLFYGVMPMAVYFGRMVDHEAVCLCLMLGALAAWQASMNPASSRMRRRLGCAGWTLAIVAAIWLDWAGLLFAALFCLHAVVRWRRHRAPVKLAILAMVVTLTSSAAMLAHLVYGGLDGRWSDLIPIFLSRVTQAEGGTLRRDLSAPGGPWVYTVQNLSWPLLVLTLVGVVSSLPPPRQRDCPQEAQAHGNSAAGPLGDALWLLPATGVIWLCVFWRQYERHNYWLFYLGPVVAVAAAKGLLSLRYRLVSTRPQLGEASFFVIIAIVVAVGLCGIDDYFSRVSYPSEAVAGLQSIHRATKPGDRVLLYQSPVFEEQRGGYRFRNLVPAQRAYYLDRAFDVEKDLDAVAAKAPRDAVFVIPIRDAVALGARLSSLQSKFRSVAAGPDVVFELRAGR